jgi:hypothetical protein
LVRGFPSVKACKPLYIIGFPRVDISSCLSRSHGDLICSINFLGFPFSLQWQLESLVGSIPCWCSSCGGLISLCCL